MKNKKNNINEIKHNRLNFRPFFSVVITTYNRAHLITRALNSLISQTEFDWEAIIVDDDSSDDTYSKILSYTKKYSQIRYIKKIHSGEALSKNTGIYSAKGRFITFLDSDDEYDPLHLESRKQILMHNLNVELLYGGVKILGNQYVPDRYNYEKNINLNECIIGGTFFIDRNIALSLNGFRNILVGTDADLFDRAKNAGTTMIEVSQPTYIYHHETADSITNRLLADL